MRIGTKIGPIGVGFSTRRRRGGSGCGWLFLGALVVSMAMRFWGWAFHSRTIGGTLLGWGCLVGAGLLVLVWVVSKVHGKK